ncbi:fungal specific transcription factor domain-containing protein [Arthroderma uncinatum]|uniref:fungal specific transcription factor domain-containing protein n=1 Tax=Arthroderma uncinatum TaxID=74035 RepID=UPI00144AF090|nr:fungal specific transcription factor domain-containing protein [Arthroderma uncinatum]KAF3480222.1 fungal specific transcription factor domain-containing protein [Arthroderma uncinatum]
MDAVYTTLLNDPLLKVSRPIAACSRCRSSKVRCDGKLPACSACERAGKARSCSGATDEFAKGKERSYVAALEAQCERLKNRLAELRGSQPGDSPDSQGTTNAVYGKETSDIDDLVGDFGFLSVNATSRDFYGITSSTSFAGLLLTVAKGPSSIPPHPPVEYPSRAEAVGHVQYYFDNLYVLMPFLMETKFWASLDNIYHDSGRFATSFDHWSMRMVLAISSAMKSRTHGDAECEAALSHVYAALKYAEDVLHPGSLAGIQSILLLTQFSMFAPKYFKTWYLIGMASRVATDLGIHQEQRSIINMDSAALNQSRKTFHCLYSIDRYVSGALGRAYSFSDDSVNVPLPPVSPSSSSTIVLGDAMFPKNIKAAIRLFEVRRRQSTYYQDLYFNGRDALPDSENVSWRRCAILMEWFETARGDLTPRLIPLYHLELLYTLILVLSPSKRAPVISKINRIILFEYAIEYLTNFHTLLNSSLYVPMTYIDFERVYTVACILIVIVNHYHNEVLSDTLPEYLMQSPSPPGTSEAPMPPYVDRAKRVNSTTRALESLAKTNSVLETAHKRWGIRSLLDDFKGRVDSATTILSFKYGEDQLAGSSMQQSSLSQPINSNGGPTTSGYVLPRRSHLSGRPSSYNGD